MSLDARFLRASHVRMLDCDWCFWQARDVLIVHHQLVADVHEVVVCSLQQLHIACTLCDRTAKHLDQSTINLFRDCFAHTSEEAIALVWPQVRECSGFGQ